MNQYWAMLEDPPDELGKVLQATNALKGDAKAWWTHELVAANRAMRLAIRLQPRRSFP